MAIADRQVWVLGEPRISDNDHQLWVLGESRNILDAVAVPAIIEGSASGSGIGLATSSSLLEVLAQALGNGIGLSLASSYLIVPAQASASGFGEGIGAAYLIIPASASGNGVGLGQAIDIVVIIYGTGTGSGIGMATAQGLAIVVLTSEEFAILQARILGLESAIAELELALEPKAHFKI